MTIRRSISRKSNKPRKHSSSRRISTPIQQISRSIDKRLIQLSDESDLELIGDIPSPHFRKIDTSKYRGSGGFSYPELMQGLNERKMTDIDDGHWYVSTWDMSSMHENPSKHGIDTKSEFYKSLDEFYKDYGLDGYDGDYDAFQDDGNYDILNDELYTASESNPFGFAFKGDNEYLDDNTTKFNHFENEGYQAVRNEYGNTIPLQVAFMLNRKFKSFDTNEPLDVLVDDTGQFWAFKPLRSETAISNEIVASQIGNMIDVDTIPIYLAVQGERKGVISPIGVSAKPLQSEIHNMDDEDVIQQLINQTILMNIINGRDRHSMQYVVDRDRVRGLDYELSFDKVDKDQSPLGRDGQHTGFVEGRSYKGNDEVMTLFRDMEGRVLDELDVSNITEDQLHDKIRTLLNDNESIRALNNSKIEHGIDIISSDENEDSPLDESEETFRENFIKQKVDTGTNNFMIETENMVVDGVKLIMYEYDYEFIDEK